MERRWSEKPYFLKDMPYPQVEGVLKLSAWRSLRQIGCSRFPRFRNIGIQATRSSSECFYLGNSFNDHSYILRTVVEVHFSYLPIYTSVYTCTVWPAAIKQRIARCILTGTNENSLTVECSTREPDGLLSVLVWEGITNCGASANMIAAVASDLEGADMFPSIFAWNILWPYENFISAI